MNTAYSVSPFPTYSSIMILIANIWSPKPFFLTKSSLHFANLPSSYFHQSLGKDSPTHFTGLTRQNYLYNYYVIFTIFTFMHWHNNCLLPLVLLCLHAKSHIRNIYFTTVSFPYFNISSYFIYTCSFTTLSLFIALLNSFLSVPICTHTHFQSISITMLDTIAFPIAFSFIKRLKWLFHTLFTYSSPLTYMNILSSFSHLHPLFISHS